MAKRPNEWNEEFADLVYGDVEKHKYFITNLGKCTQVDARVLPNSVYVQYLDLLRKEIEIINPKVIIAFGNQVSSVLSGNAISVSKCRKQSFPMEVADRRDFREQLNDRLAPIGALDLSDEDVMEGRFTEEEP